jgi:NAD(P)-dependent dehydrogenase (short-subunit alcohol dehydrogenase family)
MKVRDKVFVVTGAGAGMGRELTLGLLERGAEVVAVDIRQEGLDETTFLADAGDKLTALVVDVTDRQSVERLPEKVIDAYGAVDGLINNAGIIQPFVRVADLEYSVIDRVINVNLYGTIFMVKAFLPYLLARPEAHIANVSSMGGFLPVPGQTIYGASKAAVKLFTEGLYAEMIGTNVGVSVIMPGAVMTDIAGNSGVPMPAMSPEEIEKASGRGTSPQDAAKIMLDGIESNRLHIYVGSDSRMMSIATKLAPRKATHMIAKKMQGLLAPRPGG